MKIKMVVCDLDGTLLNDKDGVSAESIDAFQRLQRSEIITVIATGRPWLEAKKHAQEVNAQPYFIGMNGCQTFNVESGHYFLQRYLPADAVAEIMAILDTMPVFYEVYTRDTVAAPTNKAALLHRSGLNTHFIAEFADKIVYHQDISKINTEVHKFFIPTTASEVTVKLKECLKHRNDICIINSLGNFIEIIPVNINKAVAVDTLCQQLGILPDEVMAVGDSQNDIEMLQYAGVAVAVGNAIDKVKAIADYIAPDNNQHGVAWCLDNIVPKITA